MNWIEKVQKISGLNDQLTGGFIGLLIFFPIILIGIYRGYYIKVSTESIINFIALLASCIVIACQIAGILYLTRILKDIPILMKIIPESTSIEGPEKSFVIQLSPKEIPEESSKHSIVNEICMEIKRGLSNKRIYFKFYFLILIPFLILDIWFLYVRSDRDVLLFSPSARMQFAFELYGKLIAYFIEYLIAAMIWIIINIHKAIKLIANSKFRSYISIDIFAIDDIGGLGPAINATKGIAFYYFACLTLAILSFSMSLTNVINGKKFFYETKLALEFSYLMQIVIYILLLIFGLYSAWNIYLEIKNVFNKFILEETYINSKIYNEKRYRLQKKISETDRNQNNEEINQLRTDLEIINTDRVNLIRSAKNGYDLSIILTIAGSFLSSLIIPILTMIEIIQRIMKGG